MRNRKISLVLIALTLWALPALAQSSQHVIGEPLPYRIRAITALVDDRVIGIGGIAFPPHGPAIAFVQLAPSSPNRDGTVCHDDHAAKSIPEARRYLESRQCD